MNSAACPERGSRGEHLSNETNPLLARALRTKAIDAGAMLCDVMDQMERLGFNGDDVRRWLVWNILPGNLMEAARDSQWDRASSASKIEAEAFGEVA